MKSQTSLSRRRFLRGRFNQEKPVRPPWSISENIFLDTCIRCTECIERCPNGLLKKGSGGFPEVDFSRASCNFCGECQKACTVGALTDSAKSPWTLKPVIGEACLAKAGVYCRTCAETCDDEVIEFRLRANGMAEPDVNTDLCRGCGECSSSCPVIAIELKQNDTHEAL
ncbi:ferredoxin-type protein NapF [Endozoicomonas lisbonensis]|uniref:Ferredoxin-type protein NapF n=2 Tax=Endozoicomonas lisbonensis TaxID=3120522 RepID=A0ABV2SQ58_9GAMM